MCIGHGFSVSISSTNTNVQTSERVSRALSPFISLYLSGTILMMYDEE